jgi:hypothetical protein
MHVHLDAPDLKPDNPTDSRLKYLAHTEFQLVNNRLSRRSDSKLPNLRNTVPETEVLIKLQMSIQFLHAGQIRDLGDNSTKVLWDQSPGSLHLS